MYRKTFTATPRYKRNNLGPFVSKGEGSFPPPKVVHKGPYFIISYPHAPYCILQPIEITEYDQTISFVDFFAFL